MGRPVTPGRRPGWRPPAAPRSGEAGREGGGSGGACRNLLEPTTRDAVLLTRRLTVANPDEPGDRSGAGTVGKPLAEDAVGLVDVLARGAHREPGRVTLGHEDHAAQRLQRRAVDPRLDDLRRGIAVGLDDVGHLGFAGDRLVVRTGDDVLFHTGAERSGHATKLIASGAAPPTHGSAVLPHPRPARWRSRGREALADRQRIVDPLTQAPSCLGGCAPDARLRRAPPSSPGSLALARSEALADRQQIVDPLTQAPTCAGRRGRPPPPGPAAPGPAPASRGGPPARTPRCR